MTTASELLGREAGAMVRRLFAKDPTLWAGDSTTPELADRLGWLDAPQRYRTAVSDLLALRDAVHGAGFARVLLLGMGGSSLAPEVFARTFRTTGGSSPELVVLDSTHPDMVLPTLEACDTTKTLFVVSSKSGSTVETSSLCELCWDRAGRRGAPFVAITDPGSGLARLAAARGFRRCFENDPFIGGRFSALSFFGLVPAALCGAPIQEILVAAEAAAIASAAAARSEDAGGVLGADLGAHLAAGWLDGRDKLTLMTSPAFGAFGVWMEQLVAESTGKLGKGIVPIVDEPLAARAPGDDRTYVTMIQSGQALDVPPGVEAHAIDGLVPHDLGREFYRWEVATALAGAWQRVNPFDQPNVAESKHNSEQALKALAAGEAPAAATGLDGLETALRAWLGAIRPRDYAALLAYIPRSPAHESLLAGMRRTILAATGVATTAGYGPRFLHSTGQLHKGGPPSGVFLQIETEPSRDAAVPGSSMTFGQLVLAQALGDYRALSSRGRRVLRVRVRATELAEVAAALERAAG